MSGQVTRIKRQENLSARHRPCFVAGLLQAPRAFQQESLAARRVLRPQVFGKLARLAGGRALQESKFHLVKVPAPVSEELAGCCLFAKRPREESESVRPAAAMLLGGAAKEPGVLGPEQIRKRDSQV